MSTDFAFEFLQEKRSLLIDKNGKKSFFDFYDWCEFIFMCWSDFKAD